MNASNCDKLGISGLALRRCQESERHREMFARLYGGVPPVQPTNRLPCLHLGAETGETEDCGTCRGKVRLKLFSCAHPDHGPAVLPKKCAACPGYAAYPPVTTRHLLYYVYPVAGNGVWQCNVDQLLERIDLFNGRRVAAIAHQAGRVQPRREKHIAQRPPHKVDEPEAVMERLKNHGFEFITLSNSVELGEVAGFGPMMERVQDCIGPGDATFYAHTKGVSRPVNEGVSVHPWATLLYAANLDYWTIVGKLLEAHPIAGAFKTHGKATAYPGDHHYSGTFFWFRNREAFARDWRRVPQVWGGVEAWPGAVFASNEAACIFFEETVRPMVTGYDFPRLREVMNQFAAWSERNAAHRRPGAEPRPWLTRHGYE